MKVSIKLNGTKEENFEVKKTKAEMCDYLPKLCENIEMQMPLVALDYAIGEEETVIMADSGHGRFLDFAVEVLKKSLT